MGQQTKSTKSKPRKRRNDGGNRVVFIIAAVLMVIYLGGRLSNAFSAAPETTPALHVTVNDSFTSDGWFFRDEEPIDNATGSSVKHSVYSGERVQQDAPLAIIYSDQESMDLSRQLDPLEERISLLDTALQSTSDSSNIASWIRSSPDDRAAGRAGEGRQRLFGRVCRKFAAHAVAAPRGRQCGYQRGICRT
ncbi:MAG: HlyD family efflux transporter periplasmic adaptor subunit [Butyricicoccus sp.]